MYLSYLPQARMTAGSIAPMWWTRCDLCDVALHPFVTKSLAKCPCVGATPLASRVVLATG